MNEGSPVTDKFPCVLIVEDDPDIRELSCRFLKEKGYSVQTCKDGWEALAFLDTHLDPCLILLDMMMPIMNGRDFMAAFAMRPHTIVPIPIYLVSATAQKKDGREIGCLGFLKKPVNLDALLAIVQRHCSRIS